MMIPDCASTHQDKQTYIYLHRSDAKHINDLVSRVESPNPAILNQNP